MCTTVTDDDIVRPEYELAVDSGHYEIALYLIGCGFGKDSDKEKLFSAACSKERLDVLEELIKVLHFEPKGTLCSVEHLSEHVWYQWNPS